ncbi:MAG: hypothetical protein KF773_10505 [Deltaproteobacteria bacterium]|nr:hypothetical protein [Deltaproteobacteria bacterium]MCW5808178.1 hypothetical protein [Deltaproteobacteria bacterium]
MKHLLLACLAALAFGCGGKNGGNGNTDASGGDGDGPPGGGDGRPAFDAALPPGCTGPVAGAPQCSNCIDDDNDGYIDQNDIECTGPLDNDEGSFKTGLPGDNSDPKHQDCFFDGDSGAGNDGCDVHTCCLLGITTQAACNAAGYQGNYVPNNCPPPVGTKQVSDQCKMTCGSATPPGCDCFGCCTICEPGGTQCYDISINPAVSPNCTQQTLADPATCHRCQKVTGCGPTMCGGETCILCPGQDPGQLPPSCNGTTSCPAGTASCAMGQACPANAYCDTGSGCCLSIIQ